MKRVSQEYKDYLQSPQWASIATGIKARDGWTCRVCGKTNEKIVLEVHHIRGAHRFHEKNHPEDLLTLCQECHKTIHRYFAEKDLQDAKYALDKYKNGK